MSVRSSQQSDSQEARARRPTYATMPGLTIGDTVPNLELDSTHGKIRIHDYVGDGYAIIFSHPGTSAAGRRSAICMPCSRAPADGR